MEGGKPYRRCLGLLLVEVRMPGTKGAPFRPRGGVTIGTRTDKEVEVVSFQNSGTEEGPRQGWGWR